MLKAALAALAVVAGAWPVSAAIKVTYAPIGTGPHAVVHVEGKIEPADGAIFASLLNLVEAKNLIPAVVSLNSPGGSVAAAMAIGETIRHRRMGTIVFSGNRCMSACAYLWMAGVIRRADGQLGVHRSYDPTHENSQSEDVRMMEIKYLSRMNAPEWLHPLMQRIEPIDMYMLEAPEIASMQYAPEGWSIAAEACPGLKADAVADDCAWRAVMAATNGAVVEPAAESLPVETVTLAPKAESEQKAKPKRKRLLSGRDRYPTN